MGDRNRIDLMRRNCDRQIDSQSVCGTHYGGGGGADHDTVSSSSASPQLPRASRTIDLISMSADSLIA